MAKKQKSTFQKVTKAVVYLMLFVMIAGVVIGALTAFQ